MIDLNWTSYLFSFCSHS